MFSERDIFAAWDCVDQPTLSMDFMGPLRLLLALRDQPQHRDILSLDMHNEERKKRYNIKYFVGCEDIILKYIKDACGIDSFSDEEVLTAIGLFDMFGVNIMNGAKAFHPSTVFMRNSCTPNTYSSLRPDMAVVVRASTSLKKGEPVTRCFSDVLSCNMLRRRELAKDFFLDCDCSRCRDGSEMGTNYGGLLCGGCNKGVAIPQDPR